MIRNVFGKAVTEVTPGAREGGISRNDLASLALVLKNSQGKDKHEEEALRYVDALRENTVREHNRCTLGWIYNATGSAITLVQSRDWQGCLAPSNLYPVRIENGQWGVFLHIIQDSYESTAAVLYEGFNYYGKTCYWWIAWRNRSGLSSPQVHVKVGRDVDWCEDEWSNLSKANDKWPSIHRAKEEGWSSVISASPGPYVVFEALLTLEEL